MTEPNIDKDGEQQELSYAIGRRKSSLWSMFCTQKAYPIIQQFQSPVYTQRKWSICVYQRTRPIYKKVNNNSISPNLEHKCSSKAENNINCGIHSQWVTLKQWNLTKYNYPGQWRPARRLYTYDAICIKFKHGETIHGIRNLANGDPERGRLCPAPKGIQIGLLDY